MQLLVIESSPVLLEGGLARTLGKEGRDRGKRGGQTVCGQTKRGSQLPLPRILFSFCLFLPLIPNVPRPFPFWGEQSSHLRAAAASTKPLPLFRREISAVRFEARDAEWLVSFFS